VAMSEGDLDVFALKVNDRIEDFAGNVFGEEIVKAAAGAELFAVEEEGEAGVQIGIVPEHVLDVVGKPAIFAEHLRIGRKGNGGSRIERRLLNGRVFFRHATRELDDLGLVLANGLDIKIGGQRVDGLNSDAVQTNGLLERFGIVFGAGIDF